MLSDLTLTIVCRDPPLSHYGTVDTAWINLRDPRTCVIGGTLQQALLGHPDTPNYCQTVQDQLRNGRIVSSSLLGLLSAVEHEIGRPSVTTIRSTLEILVRNDIRRTGSIAGPLWDYIGPVVVRLIWQDGVCCLSEQGAECLVHLSSFKMSHEHGVCLLQHTRDSEFYARFVMYDIVETGVLRVATWDESVRCFRP